MANHDEAIAELCGLTGASEQTARSYLSQCDWNVQTAAASLFEDQEEADAESAPQEAGPVQGSGDLKGKSRSTASSSRPPQKKQFGSLRDLQRASEEAGEDDDDDKEQEFFAGGDKSGLAVQDPSQGSRDHVRRLLETARRNGPPPPREEPQASNFRGSGQTLGGDDAPSRVIPDPSAHEPRPLPMVERTLHLWADGFSVDDGPLYRYDDPANARTLEMINRGSAPLDIMNVENGQAVDVKLDQHPGEKYVQPKKKYQPFGGSGYRLGSPTPGPSGGAPSTTASAPAAALAAPAAPAATLAPATAAAPASSAPSVSVNDSEPTVTLQIRLADGTRLPSRFNTTHTIGDVYAFVAQANSASQSRAYTLATTFPTKELTDKSQQIGELAELKRGGVVVQKWS